MSSHVASHRAEYKGWQMQIYLKSVHGEGTVAGHVDLRHAEMLRCRIPLAGPHRDGVSAMRALGEKARCYVDDWLRHHSGNTAVADL